jgi:hypothetical protein
MHTLTHRFVQVYNQMHTNIRSHLILSYTALNPSALPFIFSTHTNSTLALSEFPYSDKNCDNCVWYSLGAAMYISDLYKIVFYQYHNHNNNNNNNYYNSYNYNYIIIIIIRTKSVIIESDILLEPLCIFLIYTYIYIHIYIRIYI